MTNLLTNDSAEMIRCSTAPQRSSDLVDGAFIYLGRFSLGSILGDLAAYRFDLAEEVLALGRTPDSLTPSATAQVGRRRSRCRLPWRRDLQNQAQRSINPQGVANVASVGR
jgi:hypothetical protein